MRRPRLGRLVSRIVVAVAAYAVLLVGTSALDFDPHPVRLALVVALGLAGLWLLVDVAVDESLRWQPDPISLSVQAGRDARFDNYVRVIEGHLTAREPSPLLQERLAALAASVLDQRYGLDLDDPHATALLGPDAMAVLRGPAHRMSLADVDQCVTRIEEL